MVGPGVGAVGGGTGWSTASVWVVVASGAGVQGVEVRIGRVYVL